MTLTELYELIKEVYGEVPNIVARQISKFNEEGYTYKEIGRCFYYFYVVKGNSLENLEKYGIGIVPHIRIEANQYYDNLKQKNDLQSKAAKQILTKEIKEVNIKPVRRSFCKKGVDISEL